MIQRNKIRNCICIIGLFWTLFYSGADAENKLILRGSNNYPPFEFINESGKPDGFNVEIIRALMEECGYSYDLKLEEWENVTRDIRDKKIDAVLGMIYSPERAANVRFTLPTCIINRNFITRESDNYRSFKDLEGKEVIVEKGGWFHRYLLENNFSVKIIESNDVYESLKLFESGKHDAVLASDLVAIYAIKQLGIKNLKIKDMGIESQNYSIAVNRDNNELLYHLNLGLQQLKLSGTYDKVYNKWFGIYESQKRNEQLLIAFIVFIAVVLLLVLFLWLLRRQVARATRLLNNSKQEVEIAIDAGKISAWVYNVNGKKFVSLHGESFGKAECRIDEVYEMIHPEDAASFLQNIELLSEKQKERASLSFRMRREGKEQYRYVETKMVRAEATKELPFRIVGTFKDVSEEILLREQLKEYRVKSEAIIKVNDIILIQYDIDNKLFIRINNDEFHDATYNIRQYLDRVYPEDIVAATHFIESMNRGENETVETELRIIAESGDYCWYAITAFAYTHDEDGKITSYMGLRRNNTKWKEINNDLILLREKAEASNRLKSAFLANMSHEIRTPLNAIVGFSELIIDTADEQERNDYIDIVRTNNSLLLQLINDVLDLSKIEAGHVDFYFTSFDFPTYFQELGMSLSIKETENVKLEYINRYTSLSVYSDKNRISQVVTNFVGNAFKFTEKGSITMDYRYEDEGIRVSVTDTGIGIAAENLNRVFERFEKINDFAQGTGLGLSICKVIIETLGGKIGVESKQGSGSSFWFWIPSNSVLPQLSAESEVMPDNSVITGTIFKQENSSEKLFHKDKRTVLIAEDIDNNYFIINTIIKDKYNVIRAKNGLEAVEKTKRHNPDFILMDMKMPVMNGLDATKEIRKFDPEIPIVALTAYVFDTNKQDAMSAGCNEFLTKPVNRSVLMDILEQLD